MSNTNYGNEKQRKLIEEQTKAFIKAGGKIEEKPAPEFDGMKARMGGESPIGSIMG